jgi:hypothetical protein
MAVGRFEDRVDGLVRYGRPVTDPSTLSRRALMRAGLGGVALGGAALVSGCAESSSTSDSASGSPSRSASGGADEDPDVRLLTAAIQDEAGLLGLAVVTGREHGELVDVVQPVVSRQRAHVRELSGALTEPPDVHRARPGPVPASTAKALASLSHAVATAEAARLEDCLAATSGLLARMFASVSASHATTVETLRVAR